MSLHVDAHPFDARRMPSRISDFDPEESIEIELLWIEAAVGVTGIAVAIGVVSSIAVLMYLS